jgi:hypothetical protein
MEFYVLSQTGRRQGMEIGKHGENFTVSPYHALTVSSANEG